ncbi:hypothetical protein [Alteromonas confluentis]|uniref:Right handed beta helix domain-containing protein n=1 Tax=Alteromonas confluentis TaxID=1656094 RepID=A0A1E7Z904_9ALTE|nr:hypothetical protein [Alteromonas confluentis]OFC69921.1 hypothetical protein BFC18_15820 [Alteromonas confluentis]
MAIVQKTPRSVKHTVLISFLITAFAGCTSIQSQAEIVNNSDTSQAAPFTNGLSPEVVPLIESVSIRLPDIAEDTINNVQFREEGTISWQDAYNLLWDPKSQQFTGNIVYLDADTAYEVKIHVENAVDAYEEVFQFRTRTNTPPIDPQKVYYLSDIYSGGVLDLEALNIEGSEGAWAKIVGDANHPVEVGLDDKFAVDIGNNSYVYFENITVKGGLIHAIKAKDAHHIWINGCDVSGYGRPANFIRDGKAYYSEDDTQPINYDSGIYFSTSGVVTIENCAIHSPRMGANSWGAGHPMGPNAMLIYANHREERYRGQYIIRNNRFYGSPEKRFNDVIESRVNGRVYGGFIRDSAVYNNYFAYANDDIIELDGGQNNVLFYDNEIEQAYCGISAAPNLGGNSFIFNNYIHNLGDERGKAWGAVKVGGYKEGQSGRVNIFNNLIVTSSNGIAKAGFNGSSEFLVAAKDNIMIHDVQWSNMGYGIYDTSQLTSTVYNNNYIFNSETDRPEYVAAEVEDFKYYQDLNSTLADEISNAGSYFLLPGEHQGNNNLSKSIDGKLAVGKTE